MIPIKKIIASLILVFLILILAIIVLGKTDYTGEAVKIKETTATTETPVVETTSTVTTKTTKTTLTPTTTEQLASVAQQETNSDCEALGCPPGTMFAGSKTSKKYHNCDCTWAKKINQQNLICFKNSEETQSMGYTPCKVCKPQ